MWCCTLSSCFCPFFLSLPCRHLPLPQAHASAPSTWSSSHASAAASKANSMQPHDGKAVHAGQGKAAGRERRASTGGNLGLGARPGGKADAAVVLEWAGVARQRLCRFWYG